MKIQTFNQNLIREYMNGSWVLEQGIKYCQSITPGLTREQAKESAILQAQQRCYSIWYNDQTGYIKNELMAFREFEQIVMGKRFFYTKEMGKAEKAKENAENEKKEQERRTQKEKERVQNLKNYCKDAGLDFEVENAKAVRKLKIRNTWCIILESIGAIMFILGAIGLLFMIDTISPVVTVAAIVVGVILFIIGDKVDPKLPDGYFKKQV